MHAHRLLEQITNMAALKMDGVDGHKDLFWPTLDAMYNNFREYNGTVVYIFIEANMQAFTNLIYDVARAWYVEVCEGRRTLKYRCGGVQAFMKKKKNGEEAVGEATTPFNKGVKIESLRLALNTDRLLFHKGFMGMPTTPFEAKRVRDVFFGQLVSFKRAVDPRTGHVTFSGKQGGGNDDLVLTAAMLCDFVFRKAIYEHS
jgi:hypothetical protein